MPAAILGVERGAARPDARQLVEGADPSRRDSSAWCKSLDGGDRGRRAGAGRGPTASAATTAAMPTCSTAASSSAMPRAGRCARSGAMSDLTERHRAEAEIRRMQAELIHVSRLSAMGTMASTLAHELNQPLTALSNFISGTKRIAEKPDVPRDVARARRWTGPRRPRCAPARSCGGCASWCRAARSRCRPSICRS